MSSVIEAHEVARWYGQVVGLNDLSVNIGGGITGLLGPNGAGKTTFLRLIAGELKPSRGSLRVLGKDPFANRELFREIGFCPQQDALYEDMTAQAFVTLLMRFHGFDHREAAERAKTALERVGLGASSGRRVSEFSKGMRQRVRLAQSIGHSPKLLVVDEPWTGLDPIGRKETIALFKDLAQSGVHVVVSSHVLHEVEALTESIVLFHRGRLLAQGTVREIRQLLDKHPRRVRIRADQGRRLARSLIEFEEVASIQLDDEDRKLTVETRDVDSFFGRLTEAAALSPCGIRAMESMDDGLESVFDYLVE